MNGYAIIPTPRAPGIAYQIIFTDGDGVETVITVPLLPKEPAQELGDHSEIQDTLDDHQTHPPAP